MVLSVGLALLAVSCGSPRRVDYASFEKIPIAPTSMIHRILAKSNPITGRAAFYGNYGGPGNKGGPPQDEMDDVFRRHDIVYYLARTKPMMDAADRELTRRLNAMEESTLTTEGVEFRNRTTGYFDSWWCHVIGKPWKTYVHREEAQGCPFRSEAQVREFFRKDRPGIPDTSALFDGR